MKEQIKEIIFNCIEELNENLDEDQHLELATETILLGKNGKTDSITLVNLIISIEESIEENLGFSITLANEKAWSQKNSPFQTIHSLIDYIACIVEEDEKS